MSKRKKSPNNTVPLHPPDKKATNALACAVRRNSQCLWRYFLVRCGGDEHMAEELVQETCLQAYRSAGPAEGDSTEHYDRWLFGVARNVLRRQWRAINRRRRNIPTIDDEFTSKLAEAISESPMPAEIIEKKEIQQQLMMAVTDLPRCEQEVILMYYFEGHSQEKVAEAFKTTVRSVEGRLYRARQALRQKLVSGEKDNNPLED